jgi:hypothetical protein
LGIAYVKQSPDDPDDTLGRMAFARRMCAIALGVVELPPDAKVEMSIDSAGNCHVVGEVVAVANIPMIECTVKIT